jgi:nitrate/nitrite-specific signal transduction histidine kinase
MLFNRSITTQFTIVFVLALQLAVVRPIKRLTRAAERVSVG